MRRIDGRSLCCVKYEKHQLAVSAVKTRPSFHLPTIVISFGFCAGQRGVVSGVRMLKDPVAFPPTFAMGRNQVTAAGVLALICSAPVNYAANNGATCC